MRTPDAVNTLKIKPNPTATVTGVCHKLDQKDYSQLIHATCYSEVNQAVVVLVSGKPSGMTGQAVGEHITKELGKSYIPAAVFLDKPEWDGVSISFLLNGDYYGPYSGRDWKDGKAVLEAHAPQAWFR